MLENRNLRTHLPNNVNYFHFCKCHQNNFESKSMDVLSTANDNFMYRFKISDIYHIF